MEENKEMKNGMISEEALDEIAGGLSVKKGLLIGALAAAGVGVAGAGAFAAWKHFGKKENPNPLGLGDGILDDAENEGKLQGIIAANKAARSANKPHHTPKTHPNANPLGLGDGLLDDAERYGK